MAYAYFAVAEEAANKTSKRDKKITHSTKTPMIFPKSFDLTLTQKGLWWINKLAPNSIAYLIFQFTESPLSLCFLLRLQLRYNITWYYKFLSRDFDIKLMQTCWNEVTATYDMMRAVIVTDKDGLPIHEIRDNIAKI
jgi:hypothetical protein